MCVTTLERNSCYVTGMGKTMFKKKKKKILTSLFFIFSYYPLLFYFSRSAFYTRKIKTNKWISIEKGKRNEPNISDERKREYNNYYSINASCVNAIFIIIRYSRYRYSHYIVNTKHIQCWMYQCVHLNGNKLPIVGLFGFRLP